MLKVRSKFRLIVAGYMALPVTIFTLCLYKTSIFTDPSFQTALSICIGLIIITAISNPLLIGLKWLFLSQAEQISNICKDIKKGRYRYFSLPNESVETGDENELLFLMRNMNWMIRQIESREQELESRVTRRTKDLEHANRKLKKARDDAKASSHAKSQFLATMSHEIRTPMNAMIGMSDLVLKSDIPLREKEYIGIINQSSKGLLKILNDILDFSKIDAGKLDIEQIPLSITTLVEEISDLFKHDISGKPVEFILDIDPSVPAQIIGDPVRLKQVLINLVSNAVKFTRKGEITIQVLREEGDRVDKARLVFSVKDTGIGMDRETQDSLFQAFSQADGSTSRKFGGTGLGLAISKKIVHLMGSDICVTSSLGKGSCFSFVLDMDIDPQPALPGQYVAADFSDMQIVVAIGHETTNKIMSRFLRAFGFKTLAGKTWQQAILNLSNADQFKDVNLVILDLDQPEFLHLPESSIKVLTCERIPVMAIGTDEKTDLPDQLTWVKKFIPKPVKQSILFDTIQEILITHATPSRSVARKTENRFTPPEKTRILLVEDNHINQTVAKEILNSVGIDPVISGSGEQALAAIKTQPFDAILMDIQMPGMDGYDTTRSIRENLLFKNIPIIGMSANAMDEDRQKGHAAGMTAYITKPVEPDILFTTLSECLDRAPSMPVKLPGNTLEKNKELQDIIPGIDHISALARLQGNRGLLKNLVSDFTRDYLDFFMDIVRTIRESHPKELSSMLHKILGNAKNLSAIDLCDHLEALSGTIREMEDNINPDHPDLVSAGTRCRHEFFRIYDAVQKNNPESNFEPDHPAAQSVMDETFFNTIIEKAGELKQLLEKNSLQAKTRAKEFSSHLSATPFKEAAATLELQIQRFDFISAKETFEKLDTNLRKLSKETVLN